MKSFDNVYITGDTHGDFNGIKNFCIDRDTTKNDLIIILGDSGLNYYGENNSRERNLKKVVNNLPITIFCIRGNHEARPEDRINIKSIDYNIGNNVYREDCYESILYAQDGGEYIFNNKKILTIGGAYSVDKYYRLIRGWNWFSNEMLSQEEQDLIYNKCRDKHYDYVFTHTCPIEWEPTDLFLSMIDQDSVDKTMEQFLSKIEKHITYDNWFFGHYHDDRIKMFNNPKINMLFHKIITLEE